MMLELTSSAFTHEGEIPALYTCDGEGCSPAPALCTCDQEDRSPALSWSGMPGKAAHQAMAAARLTLLTGFSASANLCGTPIRASQKIEKRRLDAMKIRPLGDRILVKRIKEEEKTKGGIFIPDTAKEKPQEGRIVAVGKGKMTEAGKLVAPEVKAGDTILFGKYSCSEVKVDGEEHMIMREEDLLGVLEG
jgi:chaperonin GroES